jgi:citronellol/citronellal dehydrogenase
MSIAGKTLFITGASRGIGKVIALRAARDGANVAKPEQPHPKLLRGRLSPQRRRRHGEASSSQAAQAVQEQLDKPMCRSVPLLPTTPRSFGGLSAITHGAR